MNKILGTTVMLCFVIAAASDSFAADTATSTATPQKSATGTVAKKTPATAPRTSSKVAKDAQKAPPTKRAKGKKSDSCGGCPTNTSPK